MRALCAALARRLGEPRIIYSRDGRRPYLSRWYVLGAARDSHGRPVGTSLFPRSPVNLFLHRFHRGDEDRRLHSHPWSWSVSLILAGGYIEERRHGDRVRTHVLWPSNVNVIRAEDFHRVDLIEDDAWTLFLAGPKASTWFFWDRNTKKRCGWREFCDWTEGGTEPTWVPDLREAA